MKRKMTKCQNKNIFGYYFLTHDNVCIIGIKLAGKNIKNESD